MILLARWQPTIVETGEKPIELELKHGYYPIRLTVRTFVFFMKFLCNALGSSLFIGSRRRTGLGCRTNCVIARCKLRSEEHTSELQSRGHLVCRLLLEQKKAVTSSIAPAFS